jgi:hypothetical protein
LMMKAYYNIEVPSKGNNLDFSLPGDFRFSFHCPEGDEDILIAKQCLGLKNPRYFLIF